MSEIVNVDQAAQWDGPAGDAWVVREKILNSSLAAHTASLLAAADLRPADRVLDVGCGTGDTTRGGARRSASDGHALGVDLSAAMLARARERAAQAGLTNVAFEQADAQVHPFATSGFDVLLSRFGVMFFSDPVAAFSNLSRAVVPGGRLVIIVWQELARNEWVAVPRAALALGRDLEPVPENVPGPFGLADPDGVRRVLSTAGFRAVELEDLVVPFWFGADADAATDFARDVGILRVALEGLDDDDTARALDALHATFAPRASADGVVLESRAWIVTAVR